MTAKIAWSKIGELAGRNRDGGKKGFGWERWSRPWLYDTLKLFSGYRVRRDMPKVAPA
jgi:hypothetical protein